VSGWSSIERSARRLWNGRRSSALVALLGATLVAASGCSSGKRLDAQEQSGRFTVAVPTKTFPASQTMSEHTHLVLVIRNAGAKPMPNVAVTICNVTCTYPAPPGEGTSVLPFANLNPQPYEANHSQQIWVVDRPPGPCTGPYGYSCAGGSFGGYVSLDSNTWALGHPLKPGESATFDWAVTAVRAGHFVVAWAVSAGLAGQSKASLSDGSQPHGTFPVTISAAPAQQTVNNGGQIVSAPSPQGGG
jgi:hypothetical protein